MYLKGGHFDLAAQLAEEMGDYAAASGYYVEAGDLKAAGEAELQLDNPEAAARLFSRAGQHVRATSCQDAASRQLSHAARENDESVR